MIEVREFLKDYLYPVLDVPEIAGVLELTKVLCQSSQEFELCFIEKGSILKVTRTYTSVIDKILLESNFLCSFEVYKQSDNMQNTARIVFSNMINLAQHFGLLENNLTNGRVDISDQLMLNMLLVKASKSLDYDMLLWVRDNVCDDYIAITHPSVKDLLTYCLTTHKPMTAEGN